MVKAYSTQQKTDMLKLQPYFNYLMAYALTKVDYFGIVFMP